MFISFGHSYQLVEITNRPYKRGEVALFRLSHLYHGLSALPMGLQALDEDAYARLPPPIVCQHLANSLAARRLARILDTDSGVLQ